MNSPTMRATLANLLSGRSRRLAVVGAVLLSVALAGCAGPAQTPAVTATRYTLADTAKVALLDATVRQAVECTGLQVSRRADGRMEVIASLKNLGRPTLAVRVSAIFSGPMGEASAGETAWHRLTLEGNNTVVARFVSRDARAADFVVRVRQAE